MRHTPFVLLCALALVLQAKATKINVQQLRCLVCKTSLDELSYKVSQIDPTRKMDIGGYRLDTDGNYKHKSVPQAKSEVHLSELIEDICNKMDDYVRATWKSNGQLTLLRLITDDGKMNSAMSEVDIIQDDDLNKSLKYYCEGIMEEYEENIIKHIQDTDLEHLNTRVCVEDTALCQPDEETASRDEDIYFDKNEL